MSSNSDSWQQQPTCWSCICQIIYLFSPYCKIVIKIMVINNRYLEILKLFHLNRWYQVFQLWKLKTAAYLLKLHLSKNSFIQTALPKPCDQIDIAFNIAGILSSQHLNCKNLIQRWGEETKLYNLAQYQSAWSLESHLWILLTASTIAPWLAPFFVLN